MCLLQVGDEIVHIGRAHVPSRHSDIQLLTCRIDAMGNGAAQRIAIVTAMITVAVGAIVVRVIRKQSFYGQCRGFDPELWPESSAFPLGAMTGNAAAAVTTHVHIHVATAGIGVDQGVRDTAASEVDALAI